MTKLGVNESKINMNIGKQPKDRSKVTSRQSVRCVVVKDNKYLMIGSKLGDLQFPGGGIEQGETCQEAGIRELHEETGYRCDSELFYIGRVAACREDKYVKDHYYETESFFYSCSVEDSPDPPKLTVGEINHGCHPIWISREDLLDQNNRYQKGIGQEDVWCQMVEAVINTLD